MKFFDYVEKVARPWCRTYNTHERRRYLHQCILIFKSLNNFIPNSRISTYNIHQSAKIHLLVPLANWGKQKPTYEAVKDFNNLDHALVNDVKPILLLG